MSAYDEVEIEDMECNEELGAYTYPRPCGDLFQVTLADLRLGEEIARCPSCSLFLTVIYNAEDFADAKEPGPAPRCRRLRRPLPDDLIKERSESSFLTKSSLLTCTGAFVLVVR